MPTSLPCPQAQKHPIFEVLCIFFIWSNYSPALDGASDHQQQAIIARSIDGSPVQPFLKFFFSSIFAPSFTSLSAAFVKMTPAPVFHLLRPNCVTEYVSECGDLAQTPQQHCHQVDNRVFFISLINSQMVWKEILCFFQTYEDQCDTVYETRSECKPSYRQICTGSYERWVCTLVI